MTDAAPSPSRSLSLAFSAMVAGRIAGAAFAPALLVWSPLLWIALSPFLAHLVVAAGVTAPLPFFAVALPVSIGQCALGQRFGRALGPRAERWLGARFGQARVARYAGWLRRGAPAALLAVPGPILATLAGAVGVRGRAFWAPMLVAQVGWIGLTWALGEALTEGIQRAQGAAAAHLPALTLLFCAATAARWWWRSRGARRG